MKVRIPFMGLFTKPLRFLRNVMRVASVKVKQSLRLQLILTFALCLIVSIIIAAITGDIFGGMSRYANIDYERSIEDIDRATRNIADRINEDQYLMQNEQHLQELLDQPTSWNSVRILVVDTQGKVRYKSKNTAEEQVDLHNIIRNAMDVRNERYQRSKKGEFYSFYPVNIKPDNGYVVSIGVPEPRIVYSRNGDNEALGFLAGLGFFMFLFYFLTNRKMRYFEELTQGLLEISKGDLDFRVGKRSVDELGLLADNINFMAEELKNKIERERKAEKTKNELITNISHDLRTPLTSIMGYLRLISDHKYENETQLEEYAQISYGKSEKLKVLIEDLFDYTKLANEGVRLNKGIINLNELVEQLMEEMVPVCEANEVYFIDRIPKEKVLIPVDAEKMVRVFENILMNAIKYSYKPGAVTVEMKELEQHVVVSIHNKGDQIEKADLPKLFQRFYRMEKSRSSTTGGSGLGLAIAKSIVELHEGNIWAECEGNDIWLRVRLNK